MLRVTGGAAFTSIDYGGDFGCSGDALCNVPLHAPVAFGQTKTGWVAGIGAEHKFDSHRIGGLEFLVYGFGGTSTLGSVVTLPGGAPGGFNSCSGGVPCIGYTFGSQTIETVRARLSYKF